MASIRVQPGVTLGRYLLIRPIGTGGAGTVYEAADESLGRHVAVKVLHPPPSEGGPAEVASERFLREGRAAAQVRHPHVVAIYDVGIEADCPFLVMELVDGETLAQCVRRAGKVPLERAVEILLPLMSAVADLHAAGIVHRDIKPANVLLARGRELCPKLADFGVSRMEDGAPSFTRSGAIVGTPEYMAPELLLTAQAASELSDQYALAVILYECTTGQKPFQGATTYELMHAVVTAEAVPPSVRDASLPKAFDEVIGRAMHREPHRRFPSIDEFAAALLPFGTEAALARWRTEFVPPDTASGDDPDDASFRGVARSPSIPPVPSRRTLGRAAAVVFCAAIALSAFFFLALPSPRRSSPIGSRGLPTGEITAIVLGGDHLPATPPASDHPHDATGPQTTSAIPAAPAGIWRETFTASSAPSAKPHKMPRELTPSSMSSPHPLSPIGAASAPHVAIALPSAAPPAPLSPAVKGENGAPILDVP